MDTCQLGRRDFISRMSSGFLAPPPQTNNWQVSTTEARGINGDYMEAMAFAWLAHRNIHKLPSSLPEVTGASRPASLGVYYPKD